MVDDLFEETELRMMGAITALESDLATYRTGRASPQLLDRLTVEMYDVDVPIKQVAQISVPEAQQLVIRPYDPRNIGLIERAILKSDLSLTPNNDGKIIRLILPPLTEERRRDLSRLVGRRVEEGKVAVRNVRRDALNDLRSMKNDKNISEDEFYGREKELNELTNSYVEQIDKLGEEKEQEIMEV